MKRFGLIVAAGLLAAGSAFAQAAPVPTAIGLIDFQRSVSQCDEGLKAVAEYNQEGTKLADRLLKAQTKVTELQDKLTKAPATMSEADRNTLVKDIDKAKKDYDREQEDAQAIIDDKQDALFRPIADRVRKVVESYGKELNLAVVLNVSADLVFASDVADITTEIIRRANADFAKNPPKK